MRKIRWVIVIISLIVFGTTSQVYASVHVKGYFKKDGTYVKPHYRSNPDGDFYNNWSTYGNINPYTGKLGTKRYPDYFPFYNYFYTPYAFSDIGNYFWYNHNSFLEDSSKDNSTTPADTTTDTTSNTTTDEISNTAPSTTEGDSTTIDNTSSLNQSDNLNVASDYIDNEDTPDQIEAKSMLVDYFNEINNRSYIPAYNSWDSAWQSRHPYGTFENGYVDVINTVESMNATYNENGITLEGYISTTEGWDQTDHEYHYVYYVKEEDYTWKLVRGTLKKLW